VQLSYGTLVRVKATGDHPRLTPLPQQPHRRTALGTGADDGARFWWQYAAGADDAPASYCLHLHHLAHGDTHAADLWLTQAGAHAPRHDALDPDEHAPAHRMMTPDTSLTTVLRILSHLTRATPRKHTRTARAVIEFVATAVATGYDRYPDLEIPMPGTHFAEQLENLLATTSGTPENPRATHTMAAGELPNRPPLDSSDERVPAQTRTQGPERLLVEVTAADQEPASAHVFFKGAAAVCWKAATAADNTDGHGNRMAYYLSRFRTRAAYAFSPAPSGFGKTRAASPSEEIPAAFHR
jgi:hypothetical protein